MLAELRKTHPLSLHTVPTENLLKTKSVAPEELLNRAENVMIQMDLGHGEPGYKRTHTRSRRYNPGSFIYGQFGDLRLNLTATNSRLGFALTRYNPPIPPHEGLIMPVQEVIEKNLQEETPASVLYKVFTGLAMDGRHNIKFAMDVSSSPATLQTQVPAELFLRDGLNAMGRINCWKIGGLSWDIKEADFRQRAGDIVSGEVNLLCKPLFYPPVQTLTLRLN